MTFTRFFFAALLFFSLTALADESSQRLSVILSGLQTLQADFEQTLIRESAAETSSNGKMALQRPGKFRWEVRQPNQQRIIADGRYLWIYDADLEQVTKQRLDFHHPGSPALLLSGSIRSL